MMGIFFYVLLCALELAGAHFALKEAPKRETKSDDPFQQLFFY